MESIPLIPNSNLEEIRTNIEVWRKDFGKETNEDLLKHFEGKLFVNSKYKVKEFPQLQVGDQRKQSQYEAENVRRFYEVFRFLSPSQAADERLWAGLAIGKYWDYVRQRWKMDDNPETSNIKQHFMFGFGTVRALKRNALSRLWWLGYLTYDQSRENPWELTDLVCESADFIMHFLERSFSNNPKITRELLEGVLELRKSGYPVNTDNFGELAKYLTMLGGLYLLDIMPKGVIKQKIVEYGINNFKKINY